MYPTQAKKGIKRFLRSKAKQIVAAAAAAKEGKLVSRSRMTCWFFAPPRKPVDNLV